MSAGENKSPCSYTKFKLKTSGGIAMNADLGLKRPLTKTTRELETKLICRRQRLRNLRTRLRFFDLSESPLGY